MNNIVSKLSKARVELQERKLKKSGMNKFAGFKYYELSDFLPTVNSIFNELGLLALFSLYENEAVLIICDNDSDKELVFKTPSEIIEQKGMQPIQALGSKHTYLKRYLYLNALEIVEGDVVDAIEQIEPKLITTEQIKKLNDLLDEKRMIAMLGAYKIEDIKDMKEETANATIERLEKEKKEKEVTNINDIV